MLIKCPECELQVSDKAYSCPHCGFPLKDIPKPPTKKKKAHQRLPNGFGQISKMSNPNLRNPYRAMVSVGKKDNGRPICKMLKPQAYFRTYNEAYEALVEYNRNPYDLEDDITMQELYDKWSEQYFEKLSNPSSARMVKSCWNYCSEIYNMRVKDLRIRHIKGVIENGTAVVKGETKTLSANMKPRAKSIFNMMLDYAVEYEIVDKNVARSFDVSDESESKQHEAFSDEEMTKLWENINVPYVKWILVQCYTGFRPQELCLIETKNINYVDWTITGGMKTDAGKDRVVPVHERIRNIITENAGKNYLMEEDGKKLSYDKYRQRFNKVIAALDLNPEHKPHDPRKTFVTMAKNKGVDEYAIKRIVGHEINDITEAIYTERNTDWLHEEMAKI